MSEFHTNSVPAQPDHMLRSPWPEGEIAEPVGSGLCDRRDQISFMDDSVRRLALMALIEEEDAGAPAKPLLGSQVYRLFPVNLTPATRSYGFNSVPHEVERGLYTGHGSMVTHVTPMNRPVQPYGFAKPVPALVDMSTTTKKKMNDMSHLPGRRMHLQKQLLPFQGVGIQFAGYFPGDRGGTGVFIPRVATNHVIKKKRTRNVAVGGAKQEERHCHSQAARTDLGLPKEWTY
ncbi:hypothetical protein AKJ16_DCAP22064 [Drosera capensis]